jgi:hypothetical protein
MEVTLLRLRGFVLSTSPYSYHQITAVKWTTLWLLSQIFANVGQETGHLD